MLFLLSRLQRRNRYSTTQPLCKYPGLDTLRYLIIGLIETFLPRETVFIKTLLSSRISEAGYYLTVLHSIWSCCVVVYQHFLSNNCLATVQGVLSPMEVGALWCQPELCLITFTLFCPIDLHCEPFNYTIHHLLNMKNGVKHTLIKPCQKVFCKGPVNQANGLCGLCMYVCTSFHCISFYVFFSSKWCY